jgi:tripartite-type tricarboxylate transporter receptor subunit TctC
MNAMRQALILALCAGSALLCPVAPPAHAQLNPSRQITIVVPIGAGGGVEGPVLR